MRQTAKRTMAAVAKAVARAGLPEAQQALVMEKAAAEGLTAEQAWRVALSVAGAPSEEACSLLLEMPYSPALHDPAFVRLKRATDPLWNRERFRRNEAWRVQPETVRLLERLERLENRRRKVQSDTTQELAENDIPLPGRRHAAFRIRQIASRLAAWADELDKGECLHG